MICRYCGKLCSSSAALEEHLETCRYLDEHVITCRNTYQMVAGVVLYPCPKCGTTFKHNDRLQEHLDSHHCQALTPCPVSHCNFKTKRRSYLATHMEKRHPKRLAW